MLNYQRVSSDKTQLVDDQINYITLSYRYHLCILKIIIIMDWEIALHQQLYNCYIIYIYIYITVT